MEGKLLIELKNDISSWLFKPKDKRYVQKFCTLVGYFVSWIEELPSL